MILGFSTKFPKGKGSLSGRQTLFPEKIWKGILLRFREELKIVGESFDDYRRHHSYNIDGRYNGRPKLHTMRTDSKRRWKVGMKIHFYIGRYTSKDYWRFAPVLKVKSIQEVQIHHIDDNIKNVTVDGKLLKYRDLEKLAHNDGFDTVDDFFEWFNDNWDGVLIHWTDLKY